MKLKQQRWNPTPLLYISLTRITKGFFILMLSFSSIAFVEAQKQDYIWCFGDSAGLDFNSGGPVSFDSAIQTDEASASISNSNGSLLFYVGAENRNSIYSSVIGNNHSLLINGDSLLANSSMTNGILILPKPGSPNDYIIVHQSFGISYQLMYSLVEWDSIINEFVVTYKNMALTNDTIVEKLLAVKHGNGQDWWIITHKFNSNEFIIFLLSNSGLNFQFYQQIGPIYDWSTTQGEMATTSKGEQIACVSHGNIDLYSFNRCTGQFSNHIVISPLFQPAPFNCYYGAEFSPNDSALYVTTNCSPNSYFYQFSMVNFSFLQLYSTNQDTSALGQLELGPDGKIYMAHWAGTSFTGNPFNNFNMNLSKINSPDIIGAGCDFIPYSVQLGGRRCFGGLPNMPNYNLGALTGSPCDTLTSINSEIIIVKQFEIIPNPVLNYFKISLAGAVGGNYNLQIFNSNGKLVFEDINYLIDEYIDGDELSSGIYAITLTQKRKQWYGKFIKL